VQEVDGEDSGCLSVQELPPGRARAPLTPECWSKSPIRPAGDDGSVRVVMPSASLSPYSKRTGHAKELGNFSPLSSIRRSL
jgi:hypothetical protein